MATTIPNFEEAAAVATESIAGLDNLPNEVQHILNEINHLEKKCQDLQNEILRDQRRYIRDAIRPIAGTFLSSPGSENGGVNSKAHLPRHIANAYSEIDALSVQKIELAQRLILLLARTQARLDADVNKVRILQGEHVEESRYPTRRNEPSFSGNLQAAAQLSENLRNALESGSSDQLMIALTPTPTPAGTHPNKKRRLTTQTSIKLTAPSTTTSSTTYARSRPSRQSQATKLTLEEPEDEDLDAEGEEEFEGEEGEEDPTLYCFCQKRSYGDMIGCDNLDCPYQWFHITCVGVKTPLPDKWYCPDCIKTKGVSERRKGRKK